MSLAAELLKLDDDAIRGLSRRLEEVAPDDSVRRSSAIGRNAPRYLINGSEIVTNSAGSKVWGGPSRFAIVNFTRGSGVVNSYNRNQLDYTPAGGMNIDYIVASDGSGDYLTLFGASGALTAAIATGLSKTIWLCTTHVETQSASYAITLASGQVITILSAGGMSRPTITIGHANPVFTWTGTAGATSRLVMKGFRFYRTAANAGNFSNFSADASTMSEAWAEEMIFDGDTSNGTWGNWLDARTALSRGTIGSIRWRDVTYIGLAAAGSAHQSSIVATHTSASPGTYMDILDCDLQLTNLWFHSSTTTDVDPANRVTFLGNRMTIVQTLTADTGYGILMGSTLLSATGRGFLFNDNTIIHKANKDFISAGSSQIAKDMEMVGNYYNASISGGGAATTFANLLNTAGTVNNVTITGNTLIGPGVGNAINVNGAAATMSQFGVNAFRNWGTNVSGAGAMTTIAGPTNLAGGSSFGFVTTFSGNADALPDSAGVYLNTTGTEFMTLGFRRSSVTKGLVGIWDTTAPATFAANDLYFTTFDGAYHDMMAFANDGSKIKENAPLISGRYGYFGSTAFALPNNITNGDLTIRSLDLGGYNTLRAATTGYFLGATGTMTDTAAGATAAYFFNPTIASTSNSSADFRAMAFQMILGSSAGVTQTTVQSVFFENRHRQTGAITTLTSAVFQAVVVDASSPATVGTVTTARALDVRMFANPAGNITGTVTTGIGIDFNTNFLSAQAGSTLATTTAIYIRMLDQTVGATMSVTTLVGLDIAALTKGATNNFGIRNADRLVQTKYARFGGITAPTNYTTDGDVTAIRYGVNDDANYRIAFNGSDPEILFDSGADNLRYIRASNYLEMDIAGTQVALLGGSSTDPYFELQVSDTLASPGANQVRQYLFNRATGVLANTPRWQDENGHESGSVVKHKTSILLPAGNGFTTGFTGKVLASSAATGLTGKVVLEAPITLHSICFNVSAAAVGAGQVIRVCLYSETGVKITGSDVTEATGTGTGVRTLTLAADIYLPAGIYYAFICSSVNAATTNSTVSCFTSDDTFGAASDILSGTVVIAAGAAPSPLGTITRVANDTPVFYLIGAAP